MRITDKINAFNVDNMEFMKGVEDGYYDLAIVDPPYGININVSIGRRKGDKKSNYHKFSGGDKEIPNQEYWNELFRVSKNQIVWGGNYMTNHLYPSPCWLLWDKGFSEDVSFGQYELAWTSFKSSTKKWDYNAAKNKNRIHPTQKPVALYKWILDKYAKQGDKILDTHGGSMSIGIACHDYKFELDICELDADYFDAGVKRLKNHVAQTKLF